MVGKYRHIYWIALVWGCLWLTPTTEVRATTEVPPIDVLITNIMSKVTSVQTQGFRANWSYTKVKAMEELSDKGRVKDKEEKVYQVFPIYGRSFSRLVQTNGKPLPEKERLQEQDREIGARQNLAANKTKPYSSKKELPLTLEILSRFAFTVTGQETINGRPMWVLTFKPRGEDLPVTKIADRVVNKMTGTVWVDTEEYEIAKADMHLASHVHLVGGIVGTLRKLDYTIERTRVDEGVWFTAKSQADIEGRELIQSRHVRMREEFTGFKKHSDK